MSKREYYMHLLFPKQFYIPIYSGEIKLNGNKLKTILKHYFKNVESVRKAKNNYIYKVIINKQEYEMCVVFIPETTDACLCFPQIPQIERKLCI